MKTIALIAHDNLKNDMVKLVEGSLEFFQGKKIYATGTTASRISCPDLEVIALESGPKGGDLQIGSLIVEDKIEAVIFLWDPMSPHPHDVDVKALLRIAVLKNIPLACNLATAKILIKSFF